MRETGIFFFDMVFKIKIKIKIKISFYGALCGERD